MNREKNFLNMTACFCRTGCWVEIQMFVQCVFVWLLVVGLPSIVVRDKIKYLSLHYQPQSNKYNQLS